MSEKLRVLGVSGAKFYVGSATGLGRTVLEEYLPSVAPDGSVPLSMVMTDCGSGAIVGNVAIRTAIEDLRGCKKRQANALMQRADFFEKWLPDVPFTLTSSLAHFLEKDAASAASHSAENLIRWTTKSSKEL